MSKPSGTGPEYDVLLVDEMDQRLYFRLVSREEVNAMLSLAERQPGMEMIIRPVVSREEKS